MVIAETASLVQVAIAAGEAVSARLPAQPRTDAMQLRPAQLSQRIYSTVSSDPILSTHHETITTFLLSDCGAEALREMLSYTLAGTGGTGRNACTEVVAALMDLQVGSRLEWHPQAARLLLNNVVSHVTSTLQEAAGHRNKWVGTARSYRTTVTSDTRSGKSAGERPSRLTKLVTQLPADLQDRIDAYLDQVLVVTSRFLMPTLRENREMQFDGNYVEPRITEDESSGSDVQLHDILTTERRVVLSGPPGAGKSTTLQAVMRSYAKQSRDQIEWYAPGRSVPIRVTLRHFDEQRKKHQDYGIYRFVLQQLEENFPETIDPGTLGYLLHTGQVVLLCDGLDEVLNLSRRRDVATTLATFLTAFPSTRLLLTSRPREYQEATLPVVSVQASVEPFDFSQIRKFVQSFLGAPTGSDPGVVRFMGEVTRATELASNPLLLGVMCALFQGGRTIPNDRAELYEDCAEMLFSAWDNLREIVVVLPFEELAQRSITFLAFEVYKAAVEDFSEELVKDVLRKVFSDQEGRGQLAADRFSRDVLELWRGRRWLLERVGTRDGVDYYRFGHRSFLEYFAALHIVTEMADFEDFWGELRPVLVSGDQENFVDLTLQLTRKHLAPHLRKMLDIEIDEVKTRLTRFADEAVAPHIAHEVFAHARAIGDVLRVSRLPVVDTQRGADAVASVALRTCTLVLRRTEGRLRWRDLRGPEFDLLTSVIPLIMSLAEQKRGGVLSAHASIVNLATRGDAAAAHLLGVLLAGSSRDQELPRRGRAFARWLSLSLVALKFDEENSEGDVGEEFARERFDGSNSEEDLEYYIARYGHFGLYRSNSLWEELSDEYFEHSASDRAARIVETYVDSGKYARALCLVVAGEGERMGTLPNLRQSALRGYEDGGIRLEFSADVGAGILCAELIGDGFAERVVRIHKDLEGASVLRRLVAAIAGWGPLDALAGMEDSLPEGVTDEVFSLSSELRARLNGVY